MRINITLSPTHAGNKKALMITIDVIANEAEFNGSLMSTRDVQLDLS